MCRLSRSMLNILSMSQSKFRNLEPAPTPAAQAKSRHIRKGPGLAARVSHSTFTPAIE